MHGVFGTMQVLKLYAWELSFEEKVLGIRRQELSILKRSAYLNSVSSFTWICAPFLVLPLPPPTSLRAFAAASNEHVRLQVSLTTFAVYVLSSEDNVLDAEKAFVSLSLFNILRFPLSMLPQLIASLVQVCATAFIINIFVEWCDVTEVAGR